jgi:hypothetical protein
MTPVISFANAKISLSLSLSLSFSIFLSLFLSLSLSLSLCLSFGGGSVSFAMLIISRHSAAFLPSVYAARTIYCQELGPDTKNPIQTVSANMTM